MKQTINESAKKPKSSWSDVIMQHSAVRPIFEHELPRTQEKSTSNHGQDFSRLSLNATNTTGLNTNMRQACPFSPQRCPFGGACHTCLPRVQAKLKIGQPGDKYEQEANRVAEQVMRMPEPCSSYKEEDEEKTLQAKSIDNVGAAQADNPLIQNVLSSPGQPLDGATRSFMEPRFGQDFSGVQVHTDGQAAESARVVNARAYTVGKDVVFAQGQYIPGSYEGRRLVAHELVHVVQQADAIPRRALHRKIEVNPNLTLDTMGYSYSKKGNTYTCPRIEKGTIYHEMFTALLHSPRIFKLKGYTNKEASNNLVRNMKSRHGIIEFSSKKRYAFGSGAGFKMNPDYWKVDSSGWSLKPGVDKWKAYEDLNKQPSKYAIGCAAATEITMVGGSHSQDLDTDSGVTKYDWIPGDWGYIENTKFPSSGGIPGEEGENIIYTGKGKFWGHGSSKVYRSLVGWLKKVESWNGGALIKDWRTRPKIGLD